MSSSVSISVLLTFMFSFHHLKLLCGFWQQAGQSLAQNLAQSVEGGHKAADEKTRGHLCQEPTEDSTDEPIEEDIDVPELVEEVIEQQLIGLRDKVCGYILLFCPDVGFILDRAQSELGWSYGFW